MPGKKKLSFSAYHIVLEFVTETYRKKSSLASGCLKLQKCPTGNWAVKIDLYYLTKLFPSLPNSV